MFGYLVRRILRMVPSLLGITFVTFLLGDLAPSDRAAIELARMEAQGELAPDADRAQALRALRTRYGTHDPGSGEELGVLHRYGNWLGSVLSGDAGTRSPGQPAVGDRIREALPATLVLGCCSTLLALVVGIQLGVASGMRTGSRADRLAATGSMIVVSVPEFLLATLLLLAFGGAGLQWFPSTGWAPGRGGSLLGLVLPVATMAVPLTVVVARFVGESVRRARTAPFAQALEGLGVEQPEVRARLLRHAAAPLATLAGGFVPVLVGGSIVVESVFAMDGLGHLAFRAAVDQDMAMVMALTLLVALATLLGMTASDLAQRALDPRVGSTS